MESTPQQDLPTGGEPHNRRNLGLWAAVGVYVLATLAQLAPLLRDMAHRLPSDPGDPVLNAWILWWDAHAWPLTTHWWNAPAFYPAPGVLSFSEHLLGIAVFTAPIQWLTGSPILAYNVAFLVSFPLAATAMHLLVRELTGRDDVAFVAGAAYGFSPYRAAQMAHLQVLFSFWMPLALLGLHAGLRGRRWGFPLAAACWLLQGLANGYLLLFFPILAAFWMIWFLARRPLDFARALGWFAVAGLLVLPFLLGYLRFHDYYDLARPFSEIVRFSADVSAIFASSYHLRLWGQLLPPGPEGELFPGFAVLGLAVAAALWGVWSSHLWNVARPGAVAGWFRPVRLLAGAVAAIWGGLAFASRLTGGFNVPLGFATIPVYNPAKPFAVMLGAALIYLLSGLGAIRRPRLSRVTVFYLLAAGLMLVLCWGPDPHWFGQPFWPPGPVKAPYDWLLALPGYNGLRVPSRFATLFILCLSAAGALFLAQVLRPGRRASVVTALLGAFVLAEGWFGPVPVARSPLTDPAPWLASVAGTKAVVELPMGDPPADLAAMMRTLAHGEPVVNGYSGYFPPGERIVNRSIHDGDLSGLEALAPEGPIAVVVHTDSDRGRNLSTMLAASKAFVRRGRWPDADVYWLLRTPAPPPADGPILPIASLSSSLAANALPHMTDGELDERWGTGGPQHPGEWVTVDLGAPRRVGSLTMDLGPFSEDYPRLLQVDVSVDGTAWRPVFHGSVAGLAVQGAIRSPRALPITVPIGADARYIRLTQLGSDEQMWWTIAELIVRGPAPTAGS
ncbi:MAG: discoidin domain-containing protein [Acidobacteriota bacterium]|nr:discoidin domain-containing protein [Acidobacteriota bacterium]